MNYSLSVDQAKALIKEKLSHYFGISPDEATYDHYYKSVALILGDMMAKGRQEFSDEAKESDSKTVYYLSMEFLMGRSLKNSLYNLNLTDTFVDALNSYGISIDKLYECEPDAGLGNGGLGRLAACYLDALASKGYNGMGYSILYEFGIFKQKLIDGWQTELPDFWLPGGEIWLTERKEYTCEVRFEGYVESNWDANHNHVELRNYTPVYAVPYDMYVAGKDGKAISLLRLWSAKGAGINISEFEGGRYLQAVEQNAMAGIISKMLYPSDKHPEGKSLRLKQQYFLVSASVQDIVRRHLRRYGTIENFADKAVIHINDTHPTLAIPELMRILMDECGYGWDEAWNIVTRSVAYTNHTVLVEALECWSVDLFKRLMPRIYQITEEISNRFRAHIWGLTHDADYVERTAIIAGGTVRMANLCVAACYSVNGVSALHSNILKDSLFNDFYRVMPEKFSNVTNGIAHRRWLNQANSNLAAFLDKTIGSGYVYNPDELSKLAQFKDDPAVLNEIEKIKLANKKRFAQMLKKQQGITIDPNSIFDVQAKRLHEYKRQLLNALHILWKYLTIKENPNADFVPHTYIFAAKAASSYIEAKNVIKFIYDIGEIINNDKDVKGKMKVVFVEDFNVSIAETMMPAADVSEQISLAGKEASGTGNMKLMLNGAITLGTMDGANIEIYEQVGEDNIVIFGLRTDEVNALRSHYNPYGYYENSADIRKTIDYICTQMGEISKKVAQDLLHNDKYMVLADFADYQAAQRKIEEMWLDREKWNRMSLMNTASSGLFAADRAIDEYADNIWHIQPVK